MFLLKWGLIGVLLVSAVPAGYLPLAIWNEGSELNAQSSPRYIRLRVDHRASVDALLIMSVAWIVASGVTAFLMYRPEWLAHWTNGTLGTQGWRTLLYLGVLVGAGSSVLAPQLGAHLVRTVVL